MFGKSSGDNHDFLLRRMICDADCMGKKIVDHKCDNDREGIKCGAYTDFCVKIRSYIHIYVQLPNWIDFDIPRQNCGLKNFSL